MKAILKKERLKQIFHKISCSIYFKVSIVLAFLVGVSLTIYFIIGLSDSIPLRIITGPIIGKVTTTTARILLEFNTETLIMAILTDTTGNQVISIINTRAFIPVPFAFEGLQPNTTYTLSLSDPSITMVDSYFTTLSGESGKLNFGVVSCNDRTHQAAKTVDQDLWADMLTKSKNNEIQYLLHLGDQIYMDGGTGFPSPYDDCMTILNQTPEDQWESTKPLILEIIRNEYRLTWNLPTVKQTLAKVPSLMIFDDHEIRDTWGYLPQDTSPGTPYYFYGTLARQVYYEYERQLREDIDFDDLSVYTTEYYYEILNDIGFFFMEYRGIRSWDRAFSQMGESFIGKTETELLQQVLDPNGGDFMNLNNFFLVSTLAIIEPNQEGYPGQTVTNRESWGYAYNNERAELLNTLREWKLANENREVTILGGDTHLGSFTDIMHDEEVVLHQIVSSCVASAVLSDAALSALDITIESQPLVDNWSFKHQKLRNRHNYGIFLASTKEDKASVDYYLVSP